MCIRDRKDSDHVFVVHLLLGFVRSALERIHAVLRYDDDESGSRLTIIFEPAVLASVPKNEDPILSTNEFVHPGYCQPTHWHKPGKNVVRE